MAIKNQVKENCRILYGDDPVSISIRKEEIIREYFHGEIPDVTVLEPPGNYDYYRNYLGGQSLFSAQTAVVIQEPFFIKKAMKSAKEEKAFAEFMELLKELSSDTLVIFTAEGSLDKRTKAVKELLSVCRGEECSLLPPKEGASVMVRLLMDAGKRVEPEARSYLEEVLGSWSVLSRPLLQTECDKIVLMAGDRPGISQRLLEAALPDYMDQGIFRFTDALLAKKASVVLQSADRVFTNPSETLKNIGFLASRFRKIKMLKEMQRNRKPIPDMQKILEIRNQWAWKSLLKDASHITEADAEWFLVRLFDYQMGIRQGSSETLKDLLLQFCLRK